MESWSVYIVRCVDGSLYTGIAKDVARRVGLVLITLLLLIVRYFFKG